MQAWSSVRRRLSERPIIRDILIGIAFGALIEFIALPYYFHNSSLVRRAGDDTVDRMIRLAERTSGPLYKENLFAFIDIDDATWAAWKYPLITPRDKIAELIDHAVASKPALIFLDIDLTWPSADAKSVKTLKDLVAAYGEGKPPLLLVRSLIDPPPGGPTELPKIRYTVVEDGPSSVPSDPLPLDNLVKSVNWVSAQFELDGDGIVRHWRLYEMICDPAGGPMLLPSLQLMAALKVLQRQDDRAIPNAMAALNTLVPDTCRSAPRALPPVVVHAPTPVIVAGGYELGSRIIYTIGWRGGAPALGPYVEKTAGSLAPLVVVRSAGAILKMNPGDPIEGLADRIVVIGGSYVDSGDWHTTPIGRMPGALIAINAIHALLETGTPSEPREPARTLIALAFIVAVAMLFSVLRPILAGIAASILTFIVLVASIPLFRSGVVLDLAIPSFGVIVHNLFASFCDLLKNVRAHGFAWLQRPKE